MYNFNKISKICFVPKPPLLKHTKQKQPLPAACLVVCRQYCTMLVTAAATLESSIIITITIIIIITRNNNNSNNKNNKLPSSNMSMRTHNERLVRQDIAAAANGYNLQ
jgi:hypothetical protein